MRDYIAEDWRDILRANHLDGFDDWWALGADWIEPANRRRGGWSGVSRVTLAEGLAGERRVFLKRQEDHVLRTVAHPLRGVLTFVREMENILALRAAGVPSLEPVYFAQRSAGGRRRAVLVTESLDGFVPLEDVEPAGLPRKARGQLIRAVAEAADSLHRCKFVHNCFYPKHLFVRGGDHGFEVRLIDLEKARRRLRRGRAMFRDLDTLNRHAEGWSNTDRLRFLRRYLGEADAARWRGLWRRLARRAREKARRGTSSGGKEG